MARLDVSVFFQVAALVLMSSAASAQTPPMETGGIVGVVADSAGGLIAAAQVTIAGVRGRAETGGDGAFRMAGVPAGSQLLIARRMGFRPETLAVAVRQGIIAEVSVRMRATAQRMAAIVVHARNSRPVGRLRGFDERRVQGIGHYFTAADIERRNPLVVTDLLRTLPGVRISPQNGQRVVTFRGQRCPPLVWVDGAPATAGYLDVDIFLPGSLAGIEVYLGPATVPAALQWMRGKSSCGVIALWTQMPEPSGRRRDTPVTAQELANLIANTTLYMADGVDTAAVADTAHPVRPVYPDSLFRIGVTGRAVVEFVVDTSGVPDMDTFGVVATTDPRFAEAVRVAVRDARFAPAVRSGVRVRQLVQLPIAFSLPGVATPRSPPPGSTTPREARMTRAPAARAPGAG